ncbi:MULTISPECIES: transcriptional regulator [Flavobacterium]|uniref:transcriptional regulator n=1 Tax=Flavobacterium TaxID=237 RepID=UPI001FCAE6B1|nr:MULTISPECIES: transcriptional regulator [Flavobacterium]UOK43395.1 transcriptional regulator [Flavobacterium enshiense]
MNYIKHLTAYFDRVSSDHSLNPTHISLYVAFFQFWNLNRFQNPISINRDEIMRISKICSKATYHKCVRELHEKGYIIYEPSYNPFKGSIVHMVNLSEQLKPSLKARKSDTKNEQVTEQVLNKHCTSSGTGTEQALVSSINYINITNSLNDDEPTKTINENEFLKNEKPEEAKKKLREKKGTNQTNQIPPTWEELNTHFKQQNQPESEAQKFFNYYNSNGWLVGGKTKMRNWKAAAANWMLNSIKYKQNAAPQPNQLHTTIQKNYAEPL